MKSCECRGCGSCQDHDGLGCRRRASYVAGKWLCQHCKWEMIDNAAS